MSRIVLPLSYLLLLLTAWAPFGIVQAAPATGGYFRVVNTGEGANVYLFIIRFHRDPWRTRDNVTFSAGVVPPGGSTEWVHLPRHTRLRPVTLQIMTRRQTGNRLKALGGAQEHNTGRVEFAAALPPQGDVPASALLRTIAMSGNVVTVELDEPAFTKASQIKQDIEIGAETLALVRTFEFKGKAPERFPTGWASGTLDEYRAGRVLGFTAVSAGAPSGLPGGQRLFDELGYRYIYSYTHWLGMWNQGGGGYRRDRNIEEMQKVAEAWRSAGLIDRVYRISLRDEASLYDLNKKTQEALKDMHRDPPAWMEMIRWAGLTPQDFIHPGNPPPADASPDSADYWKALSGAGPDQRATDPQRVYNTMQTYQAIWTARFGNVREALHEAFGRPVLCTANIHFETYFRDKGGFDPWNEYSRLQTLDIPQVCDYGVGWPQQEEWLIDLQRCALRPHTQKPVDAMLQAQERYLPRPPMHLKLCAMSALGAGARSLSFYRWGPRYLDTENWYNTDPERLRMIGEINHAVGWVEDILLDGAPRQAAIAMMGSRPDAMWNMLVPARDQPSPGMYSTNLRTTYHLLRGLHHQVDFINDAVLPREQGVDIDRYRVIFIMQRCMPAEAAEELLAWVRHGGTLVGVLSIGQFDHLERPVPVMLDAFGLESLEVLQSYAEEPLVIPSAGVTLRSPTSAISRVQVRDAEILHRFADGRPAVTRRALGQGELIYAAFEPGHAYHRMSGERSELAARLRLLTGMQASVRELVGGWVRPAGLPFCAADHPLVSARLVESASGSAVFLVNATGEPALERVEIQLQNVKGDRVSSLEHGVLPAQRDGHTLRFGVPLSMTDVIRIDVD